MHAQGLLLAFISERKLADHHEHLEVAESFGLAPQVLSGEAVREREPALSDAVRGGIYFPFERHVDPVALVRALHRRCLELGVDDRGGCPHRSGRARADPGWAPSSVARGNSAPMPTSSRPARGRARCPGMFGVALPIRPGKGYSLDLPSVKLGSPVYLTDARVAATPLEGGLRLAGTMEFGGLDEHVDPVRVGAIARAPRSFFRDWSPTAEPVVGAGMRPMSPDGLPIIGRLGKLQNAYVSTGHAMLGVTLAPSSALAVSGLIVRGETSPTLVGFEADQFLR